MKSFGLKRASVVILFFVSVTCYSQETWYGEIAAYAGGGINDIFRYKELMGAPSYTGNGFFTGGASVRRIIKEWFSVEGGINFSEQYFTMHSAPTPEVITSSGHFGMLSLPVKARFDFLKYVFAEAGIVPGLQTGNTHSFDLSGLGLTAGLGLKYRFKSDIIITLGAYETQYAMLSLSGDNHPYTLSNTGLTAGVGYRFIRLGKCHCPEANVPRRKFF